MPIKKAIKLFEEDKDLINQLRSVPKLLIGESNLLSEFNIDTRIFNRSLNKTDKGKYSLCCDLFINRKQSLGNFYKEIGVSLSNKQEKLKRIIMRWKIY